MSICWRTPASEGISAPSCHAKRVVEFGEWLCGSVLKKVHHRHFVFSIPKILRIYFLFNRSLLKRLSKISWETVKDYYINTCRKDGGSPAAVAVIQTFGDYNLFFNPHMRILAADGCFEVMDSFMLPPSILILHPLRNSSYTNYLRCFWSKALLQKES